MLLNPRRALSLGAATLMLALGCGGGEESTAPGATAPSGAPSASGEQDIIRYSGETDQGEEISAQLGGDVSLPKAFPSDFPRYPGATPTAVMSAGSEGMIVVITTNDDQAVVFDFYKNGLAGEAWTVQNEAMFGNQRVIDAQKGDRKVSLGFATVEGATQVSIALQKKSG